MFRNLACSVAGCAAMIAATSGCGSSALDQAVVIGGSPSSQPFVSLAVDRFAPQNPLARFDISMAGSGQGLGKLCDGLVDLAVTAREMSPTESEACNGSGITLAKIPVARDAIVLFTNKNNPSGVSCLSLPQIYSLVGPESAGVDSWNGGAQIARALGEKDGLPKEKLTLIGPPPTSSTVDLLIDQTVAPFSAVRKSAPEIRPDYRTLASDAMIPSEVARQRSSIGFADFEKAQRWRDQVRFLKVNSGRSCVPATARTMNASWATSAARRALVSQRSASRGSTRSAEVGTACLQWTRIRRSGESPRGMMSRLVRRFG